MSALVITLHVIITIIAGLAFMAVATIAVLRLAAWLHYVVWER